MVYRIGNDRWFSSAEVEEEKQKAIAKFAEEIEAGLIMRIDNWYNYFELYKYHDYKDLRKLKKIIKDLIKSKSETK